MGLKFVSTVTGLLLGHAFTVEGAREETASFECAVNTTFLVTDEEAAASQTTCCAAVVAPVAGEKVYCKDFKCDHAAGLYAKKEGEVRLEGSTATACCRDPTCDDDSDATKKFCADAKMLYKEDNKKDLPKNTANCCSAFVKSCLYNTKYAPDFPYDLFPCSSGTIFNTSALQSLSPTQALCCKPRKEICSMVSGSVLNPTPFKCPAGFTAADKNDVRDMSASQANCCIAWTASCIDVEDDGLTGDMFQCPAGKVSTNTDASNKMAPTEANCCQAPTCSEYEMLTCKQKNDSPAGLDCDPGTILDNSKATSHYPNTDWCCKVNPVAAGGDSSDFSSAGRTGTASALSFLLLAPVVLL